MNRQTGRRRRLRLAISLLLCALALGLKLWYPQGAEQLRLWLVGQADNGVLQAFAALTEQLGQGMGVGPAVRAFCAEMTGAAAA